MPVASGACPSLFATVGKYSRPRHPSCTNYPMNASNRLFCSAHISHLCVHIGIWCVVIVHSLGSQPAVADEPRVSVQDTSAFVEIARPAECLDVLKGALLRQANAIDRVKSLKGSGILDEWFIRPNVKLPDQEGVKGNAPETKPSGQIGYKRVDGPFLVHRSSSVSFAWSEDLNSLRSNVRTIPGTTYTSTTQGKTFSVKEDLTYHILIRPDGFFEFDPDRLYGEFANFPPSLTGGKSTKVIERSPLNKAKGLRQFSNIFDPSTMFEFSGDRVDRFIRPRLEPSLAETWGRSVFLKRRSDGMLMLTEGFSNSNRADMSLPRLTVEIILDPSLEFLPTEASMLNQSNALVTRWSWSYKKSGDAIVPTYYLVDKYVPGEGRHEARSMTITEFTANGSVSKADFHFEAVGVQDGDRMLDRIENRILFMSDGMFTTISP